MPPEDNPGIRPDRPGKSFEVWFRRTLFLATAGAASVAFTGLLGYLLKLNIIGSIRSEYFPMAPNSAACFLILTLVLFFHMRKPWQTIGLNTTKTGALFVSLYGLLGFAEIFIRKDLNLDATLFPTTESIGRTPVWQMSPATGAVMALAGLGIFLLLLRGQNHRHSRRFGDWAATLGVLTTLSGATVLLAYLYGTPLMYGSSMIPMAATTAIVFVLLGIALVAAAGQESSPICHLTDDTTSAMLLRGFLPLTVFMVLLQSVLSSYLSAFFLLNQALLLAMMVVFMAMITAAVVARIARSIGNKLDDVNRKLQKAINDLQKSEEDLRLLAESMPQIVWITRPDGWNIYFNQQWVDYTGLTLEESYGHGWNKPFHPDEQQMAWDAWQNATVNSASYSIECRIRRADGAYRWWLIRGVPVIDENGSVLKWFGTCTDIDEIRNAAEGKLALEQQLQKAHKLESLGVLAGGIAHDFNNILMTIMGNAGLGLIRLGPDSPAVDNLQQIELAADKAAQLAQKMLAYSGKGQFVLEAIDLSCLVEDMAHMIGISVSNRANLRFNLEKNLPAVKADANQLNQIIMNLVLNASEAIGDKSGIIAVTTGVTDCDQAYLNTPWLHEKLAEGKYVFLEVSDTGCGMDPGTEARVFDPFFTTKFTGRGLGMAAVFGIVRGHKGIIKVTSEPGKGTTFRVLLPASGQPLERARPSHFDDGWQGRGRVLVVDDEETIRNISRDMLELLGYEVLLAENGLEALSAYRENENISIVILDLTMPRMGGEEAFCELRRINPKLKIIMTSGYNEQEVMQKFTGKGLTGFIQKPYTLDGLKTVLKKVG